MRPEYLGSAAGAEVMWAVNRMRLEVVAILGGSATEWCNAARTLWRRALVGLLSSSAWSSRGNGARICRLAYPVGGRRQFRISITAGTWGFTRQVIAQVNGLAILARER